MKTCTLTLRKLTLFALFIISSFTIKADKGDPPTIPIINWGNYMLNSVSEGLCVAMDTTNTVYLDMRIRLGTNDVTPYPSIYVQYNFGDVVVGTTPAITNADLTPVTINGIQYYEAAFAFNIDLMDECINSTESGPPYAPLYMDYEYSLMAFGLVATPGGATSTLDYYLYPVASYPQCFPLEMFAETSNGGSAPSYNGTKPICCLIPGYSGRVINQNEVDLVAQAGVAAQEDAPSNDALNVNLNSSTLIEEKRTTQGLKVFPNPVQDQVNLQFLQAEAGLSRIDLLDHQGRLIRTEQHSAATEGEQLISISTADLPAGIYYVHLRNDTFSETSKIVKLHE